MRRPGPAAVMAKTINRARIRGVGEVGQLFVGRARELWFSQETLVFLVRPSDGERASAPGLKLREATASDGPRYAADIGTDSPRTFRARLSRTSRCFVVVSDGMFVHATWLTAEGAWTRELRAMLRPPAGDAYVYESFTRPEMRGRGVYPFALNEIAGWASDHVLRKVWVAVEGDNASSLRAVSKAGFRPAGEVRYRRSQGRFAIETSELEGSGFTIETSPWVL